MAAFTGGRVPVVAPEPGAVRGSDPDGTAAAGAEPGAGSAGPRAPGRAGPDAELGDAPIRPRAAATELAPMPGTDGSMSDA